MIALGVIIGIIVILAFVAISYKNKFVVLDNRVKNSWSQIDVQMQNRFSLVPNLVETVKGYAKHEKETFEGIANAKTRYMSATTPEEKMEANNQLSGFLGRLFAISEEYNQTIQMFPGSLFAGFFNYHNAELFKANDMAREEVQVKF